MSQCVTELELQLTVIIDSSERNVQDDIFRCRPETPTSQISLSVKQETV